MKSNLLTFNNGNMVAYKRKLVFVIIENFGNMGGEIEIRSYTDNNDFKDANGNPLVKGNIHTIFINDFKLVFRKVRF